MKQQRFITLLIAAVIMITAGLHGEIIELSWESAISRCRLDNLSLQIKELDNLSQEEEVKKAWGSFLPTLDYQWAWQDDESDDAQLMMLYMSSDIPDNLFIHNLQLTLPIFTGGSRYANLNIQKHQKRSLEAAFRGEEDGTVFAALQAYFGVILSQSLLDVYQESQDLAEQNLRTVESFKEAGAATELDLRQARTRYFETIPQVGSAENQLKLTANQLKFLLNLSRDDSLIVSDILDTKEFLAEFKEMELDDLQKYAKQNRPEIIQIDQQRGMVAQQELMAKGQFLPTVALTASATHTTYSMDWRCSPSDYERYNSVGLAVQLPLIKGGSRYFDYKQAKYSVRQMDLMQEQVRDQISLDVEQSYYSYIEARDQLKSLHEALEAAQESFRLSGLYFEQGMANQTDVIAAQLSYTQNRTAFLNGVYNYNTSQLALLKAIGDLQKIWQ